MIHHCKGVPIPIVAPLLLLSLENIILGTSRYDGIKVFAIWFTIDIRMRRDDMTWHDGQL